MSWFEALAPAKVNLGLEVLGRRPDGYHELATWMLAIDLADRVRARRVAQSGLRLRVLGPQRDADVPEDERNLAWRAARAVLERAEPGAGLELELEKHVPSGAGLGGASSDAAAALLAAEGALGIELGPGERRERLAALGSDCVFFAEAGPAGLARCTGRGERVEPVEGSPPDWWLVLVTPALRCPTAAVYSALRAPLCASGAASSLPSIVSRPAREVRGELFNSLEEAALRAVPELYAWKEVVSGSGARPVQLSGSGSSFYGLFDEREEAEGELHRIADALQRAGRVPRRLAIVRPAGGGARAVGEVG